MTTLRVILGDQLGRDISSLKDCDKDNDILLMCEVRAEATYVKHHKKKIAFLFAAMRHFAEDLKNDGYDIRYVQYTDPDNAGSFAGEVARILKTEKIDKIVVTEPGEYRVLEDMQNWSKKFGCDVDILEDDRFLCSIDEFKDWIKNYKQPRMEYFYREMRKKYKVLMEGDDPVGGQWNFDKENRKPPKRSLFLPQPYTAQHTGHLKDVLQLVAREFDDHFGDLEPFHYGVTRDQALYALDKFINERLPDFGDYQDAMLQGEPWMYHSHLSFYINCGLLSPKEVIQKAEAAYHSGDVPVNAAEGFIRQIMGWREYVRGIYWSQMPGYAHKNYLHAQRKLPWFFWSGETKMNCLAQCIKETKENAYAHHIQRLMVLGNFALLAGLDVNQVNEWYLIVYADAYEWVEMPNVTGMILYADGGLLASKPYAASGAYINKMSDYCQNCEYKVTVKNGEDACPFNYLYWDFFIRNKDKFKGNNRLSFAFKNINNMDDEKRHMIQSDARKFLDSLE